MKTLKVKLTAREHEELWNLATDIARRATEPFYEQMWSKIRDALGPPTTATAATTARIGTRQASEKAIDVFMKALVLSALEVHPLALNGPLLSLTRVREQMEKHGIGRPTFDVGILRAAAHDDITLHHHDHPQALAVETKREMVTDDNGNTYIGFVFHDLDRIRKWLPSR